MRPIVVLAWAVILAVLAACAETPPTRFYLLEPIAPAAASNERGDTRIAVEPVQLPAYLDRPDIVMRSTGNRLEIGSFDRWGEPLADNVSRVLIENLSYLLRDYQVVPLPRTQPAYDLRLLVELRRFEKDASGEAVLVASWRVFDDTDREVYAHRSAFQEPVVGESYDAIVGALNTTLEKLSRHVAARLTQIDGAA